MSALYKIKGWVNMKNTYSLIIILLLLTISSVAAELTVPDLEKIDEKIRESNKDLKDYIDKSQGHTDNKFDQIDNRFDQIDNRFDSMSRLLLGLLIGVIAAVIAPILTLIGFIFWYVKRGESFLAEIRHSAEESVKKSLEISKEILEEDRKYADDMNKHINKISKDYEEFSSSYKKHIEESAKMVKDIQALYSQQLEKMQKS